MAAYTSRPTRRDFLRGIASVGAISTLSAPAISAGARPRLVIIGGGVAGAAFVRAINSWSPDTFHITVISSQRFYNAPFALHNFRQPDPANCALAPVDLASAFARQKVSLVTEHVSGVFLGNKSITFQNNKTASLPFDILVAAPGVALNWGYFGLENTPDISALWTSAATCQKLLSLLDSVPEGGTFALVAPAGPHRCIPAVYERACFAAHWFKFKNKNAKILIIDEKDQYPMQALFEETYADYYDDIVEWIPKEFHGGITGIDLEKATIQTDSDLFEADVLNVIPPQQAPDFLKAGDLVDESGYCSITTPSMQSTRSMDVYAIGDVAYAGEISKSAVSAKVEAKLAALDVIARFTGAPPERKIDISDSCWTFLAPDNAVSLGGTYNSSGNKFISKQRFISSVEDSEELRKTNADDAVKWPAAMLKSLYGQ